LNDHRSPFQQRRDLTAGTGAGSRVGVCLREFTQASITYK
jgi:hypothetical protein